MLCRGIIFYLQWLYLLKSFILRNNLKRDSNIIFHEKIKEKFMLRNYIYSSRNTTSCIKVEASFVTHHEQRYALEG